MESPDMYTLMLSVFLCSIDAGYGYSVRNKQQGLCPTWGDYQACYSIPPMNSSEEAAFHNEFKKHRGLSGYTSRALQIIWDASCRYPANMNRSQREECLSEKFPNCPKFADLPDTNGGSCTADGHPTDQIIDLVHSFTFLDGICFGVPGFLCLNITMGGQDYWREPNLGADQWTSQHLDSIRCILEQPFDSREECDRKQLRIFFILESILDSNLGVGANIDLSQFDLDSDPYEFNPQELLENVNMKRSTIYPDVNSNSNSIDKNAGKMKLNRIWPYNHLNSNHLNSNHLNSNSNSIGNIVSDSNMALDI